MRRSRSHLKNLMAHQHAGMPGGQPAGPMTQNRHAEEIQRRINALNARSQQTAPQSHMHHPQQPHFDQGYMPEYNSYAPQAAAPHYAPAPSSEPAYGYPGVDQQHGFNAAPQPFAAAPVAQVYPNPAQMHPPMYADFPSPQSRAPISDYEIEGVRQSLDHMSAKLNEIQSAGNNVQHGFGEIGNVIRNEQNRLASQVAELKSIIAGMAQSQPGREDFAGFRKALDDMGRAFETYAKAPAQSGIDNDAYARVVETSHQNLAGQIEQLQQTVSVSSGNPDIYAKTLEASHDELKAQIETLQREIVNGVKSSVSMVEQSEEQHSAVMEEINALRLTLQEQNQAGDTTDTNMSAVELRLEEITRAIVAISHSGENVDQLERIEARISELSRQVQEDVQPASSFVGSSDQYDIFARLDELSEQIASNTSPSTVESQDNVLSKLSKLTDKIDNLSAISFGDASNETAGENSVLLARLNELVDRVTESNSQANPEAAISSISAQVSELTQLFAAQRENGGVSNESIENSEAFKALDQKLDYLLEKADAEQTPGESDSAALQSINDRLKSIEEQVASSRDVALEVASQAAEDAVAKAAQEFPSHLERSIPLGVSESDISGLTHDIKALQESAARSDTDANQSFDDVKSSLERMVERLTRIEDSMMQNPASAPMQAAQFAAVAADPVAQSAPVEPAPLMDSQAQQLADETPETPVLSDAEYDNAPEQYSVDPETFVDPVPLVETKPVSGQDMVAEYRAVITEQNAEEAQEQPSIAQSLIEEANRAEEERMKIRSAKQPVEPPVLPEVNEMEFKSDPTTPILPDELPPVPELPVAEAPELAATDYASVDVQDEAADEDTPLEPGAAGPDLAALVRHANERRKSVAKASGESSGTDFIAAARRAAQAAAQEANAVQEEMNEREEDKEGGLISSLPNLFSKRKKVIMMAAGAALLAALAVPVIGSFIGSGGKTQLASLNDNKSEFVEQVEASPQLADANSSANVRVISADGDLVNDDPNAASYEESFEQLSTVSEVKSSEAQAPAKTLAYANELEFGNEALREAVAAGDADAIFEIGRRFMEGQGPEKDLTQAAIWIERAAELESASAQYLIGNLNEKGIAVPKNREAAIDWYERAAGNGNVVAMHNLAVMHATPVGDTGQPDMTEAFGWFKKAAAYGVRDSQVNLGIFYTKGVGTEVDLVEAYRWFTVAAKAGDEDAASKRSVIEDALRPDQLEQAKVLVEEWRPQEVVVAANNPKPLKEWTTDLASTPILNNKQAITKAQQMLAKLGYDAGPADGVFGKRTREAIAEFQQRVGLQVNGEVSVELLRELEAVAI